MNRWLQIHPKDNVAVALEALAAGEALSVGGQAFVLAQDIPAGHKFALKPISEGENIIKYGHPIGHATGSIPSGGHVHAHNLKTNLSQVLEYRYEPAVISLQPQAPRAFPGYVREDGQVGVRNEIWIINTVGCVNKTAEILAQRANVLFAGSCDGIFSFSHPYGCSQLGNDQVYTQKILAGLVHHPNAAGVLVLGLGCENNNIGEFKKFLGQYNPNRVKFLVCQEQEDEIEAGLSILASLCRYAQTFRRVPVDSSKLTIGLKCGGSDGFSGITANPLVGAFSDLLISTGGSTVLTEVPEMFGAETILMNRAKNRAVFDKTVKLINEFKEYYIRHGQVIYENPSPGNKAGGISSLEDKSLGCTQKGGSAPVADVIDYGSRTVSSGLNLLQAPGNDIVASTALTAAGCQMILFTTGRGTPLGAPVPTIKIASNSPLARKKATWIDFNAGRLLEGETMEELKEDLFRFCLQVAGGDIRTKNEKNGYREIAIFKDGVTL